MQDASKQQKSKDPPTSIVHKPSPNTLQYKLNMRPSSKVKTISLSSPARHKEKNKLFEGLEDSPSSTSNTSFGRMETFVPRKSIKKLNIKPKPSQVRMLKEFQCELALKLCILDSSLSTCDFLPPFVKFCYPLPTPLLGIPRTEF